MSLAHQLTHLLNAQRACCYLHNRLLDLTGLSYWTSHHGFGQEGKKRFFAEGELHSLEKRFRALRAVTRDRVLTLIHDGTRVDTSRLGTQGVRQHPSFRGSVEDRTRFHALQRDLITSYTVTHS